IRKVNRLSQKVNPAEPYAAEDAMALDSITVESWVRKQVRSRRVRAMVGLLVGSILSAHPGEVSMLYLLHYVASAGGLEPLIQVEGGAQQDRFVDGAQSLSIRLAEALGERVLLQAPVSHIFQDTEGVSIYTERRELRARYAVITAPPVVAGRIHYDPPMPTRRDQLTQRMPMGRTIKCLITYNRAFWREAGYSGEALCPDGPIAFVYDNSSHDVSTPGLVAFITGDNVRRWGDEKPEARRKMVLDTLVGYFGPEAASPTEYVEQDWNREPWSGGGPVGIAAPGALTATTDALWAPVDRLHWAGTETSDIWCGFMEGAVRSGQRAASEVAARLNL
ncbi:MAG: FAD-dependent oxidoreductase, partial [Myxococcota bacterium]|nr:FAD-dependent oxidoreductase [Myxococcota bacterium]